ncbi:S9 family peptidase [Sphingomicrobium sp. GRR-S6-50]|uniref:S9 family peptidase n=2 Tax=Sphingomicrobium sediminis TaxID=2950949 RepID=A0A9X2J525_9SPHN|nr:S9 family peptidase [Sphingomicrobium sediminis]MCM8557817.1 S9 family peptidase [Sphingomicrobium sediminis]
MPPAPIAEQRPYSFTTHGITVEDPYHWLKDQSYPKIDDEDVLAYLKKENAYFEAWKAPHEAMIESLFEEMKGRIKEDDKSVPVKDGDHVYWSEFAPGTQYRLWYRKPATGTAADAKPEGGTLLYDENKAAEGVEYFRLGAMSISPDGKLMAYSTDTSGAERYTLKIRDIATGKDLETITEVSIGQPVWTNGSDGIVYTVVNDNWRSDKAFFHKLGSEPADDVLLYEETKDPAFTVGVGKSTDESLILLQTGENSSDETYFTSADDPTQPLKLVKPRAPLQQYDVDAAHGKLWIVSNHEHVNFALYSADPADADSWETVIEGSDSFYLQGIDSHRDHMLVEGRVDGLDQLYLRDYASGAMERLPFAEEAYSASFGGNPEYAPDAYRVGYSSMVTPGTTYDYHPADKRLEVLKVQEIPSGYDADLYTVDRLMIEARDGAMVPVSVMRRKDFDLDQTGKLFVYAYGAYGYAIPPGFSTARLSLVDRGYAYAIAHIRGGDDMGKQWHLDGKLDKRENTFNDFVDVTKGLIDAGYAKAGNVAAQGGSAGGELMGAIVNQAPELYGAVVADVPFVDVLNTMLDDTLPLTPGEWNEWGNPIESKEAFETILAYSPYDNVTAQDYPSMLITGGLNDPRVTYWEPAKWTAKLRATKTDDNLLLMKMNMGAGHGGKSGRWNSLYETAEAYGFVLDQLGSE